MVSGVLWIIHIMSGYDRLGHVRSDYVMSSSLVRLFQFRTGYVRYQANSGCQVRSSYFRLVQVSSDFVSLGQVSSCYIRFWLSYFMSG
jgi:hypothetical protein